MNVRHAGSGFGVLWPRGRWLVAVAGVGLVILCIVPGPFLLIYVGMTTVGLAMYGELRGDGVTARPVSFCLPGYRESLFKRHVVGRGLSELRGCLVLQDGIGCSGDLRVYAVHYRRGTWRAGAGPVGALFSGGATAVDARRRPAGARRAERTGPCNRRCCGRHIRGACDSGYDRGCRVADLLLACSHPIGRIRRSWALGGDRPYVVLLAVSAGAVGDRVEALPRLDFASGPGWNRRGGHS
jgi:hypothetical protein